MHSWLAPIVDRNVMIQSVSQDIRRLAYEEVRENECRCVAREHTRRIEAKY
jgi:hypothetical protein